jgi:hypothetical protein
VRTASGGQLKPDNGNYLESDPIVQVGPMLSSDPLAIGPQSGLSRGGGGRIVFAAEFPERA